MNALISPVRRHPLVAFFALTYTISWAIWLPMVAASMGIGSLAGNALNVIAIAGPSIAALVVAVTLGAARLRDLLAGFSLSRVSARWALVALALPLLMIAVAIVVGGAVFETPPPAFSIGLIGIVGVEFVRILVLGGPLGEELGWRGFALPRLQLRRTAFDASVLLGVIWGLWHIPLYFVPGTGQFETLIAGTDPAFAIGGFVGWTISLSVLFTWLFNETRGSVLVVMLFHTAVNLAVFLPSALGSTGIVSLLNVAVTWLVAIAVTWRFGRATLASSRQVIGAGARVRTGTSGDAAMTARISISDQRLTIQRSGVARWFGAPVDVLLTHVVSVGIAGPDDLKGWYRAIRLAGIQIPGLMTVGTFRHGGQLTWWDVRRGSSVVVITLRDERLTRLLVEVEDPLALTRTLDQALAGANLPSDASIR